MKRAWCIALIAVCLLPVAAIGWRFRATPYLGWLDDDGVYAVTARSLAEGRGYRQEHLPDAPPQTKYPPLFPLYLAAFWRAGLPGLMAAQLALLPVFAALSWLWWRRQGFGDVTCALMGAFILLNPYTAILATSSMSELLFTCLLLACILTASRPALSGALGGLACLTRLIGLPLLAAIPLVHWVRGDKKAAVRSCAFLIPFVAGWFIWSATHRTHSPDPVFSYYTDYLGFWLANLRWQDVPLLILRNTNTLVLGLSGLFSMEAGENPISALIFRLFAFAAAAGCVRLVRRNGLDPFPVYGAGLTVMLIVWNYTPHERFVWPLLPLLAAGFAAEMQNIVRLLRAAVESGQRIAAMAVAGIVLSLIGVALYRDALVTFRDLPEHYAAEERDEPQRLAVAAWLRTNLGLEARITAYNGPKTYMDSGLRGYTPRVPTNFYRPADHPLYVDYFRHLPEFARQNRLKYILVTPDDFSMILSAAEIRSVKASLAARPDLTRVYSEDGTIVYRVEPRN